MARAAGGPAWTATRPWVQRRRPRPRDPRRGRPGRADLIVLDTSAAIQLVLRAPVAGAIANALADEDVRAPVHFDAEAFAALRRAVLTGRLPLVAALDALDDLRHLTVTRHAITGMLPEAMALRDRFGGYDVFFVILARQLGATLVTSDARLARAAAGYVDVRAVL